MSHNLLTAVHRPGFLVGALALNWVGNLLWILIAVAAGRQESRWIRQELAEEVREGLLTAIEARRTSSYRARAWARAEERRGSPRGRLFVELYAAAAELALAKRKARWETDPHPQLERVEELRSEVLRLRAALEIATAAGEQT
jgi:hypothetical protein